MKLNLLLSLALATGAYTILVSTFIIRELGGLEHVRQKISKFRA